MSSLTDYHYQEVENRDTVTYTSKSGTPIEIVSKVILRQDMQTYQPHNENIIATTVGNLMRKWTLPVLKIDPVK